MSQGQKRVALIFGSLILFCAAMMIIGDFLGPSIGSKITDAGGDGFKMAISALVGALSAILAQKKD